MDTVKQEKSNVLVIAVMFLLFFMIAFVTNFAGSMGVIVKTQVNSIFGGVEDKTNAAKSAKKTVYIRGDCVLGGLEIK